MGRGVWFSLVEEAVSFSCMGGNPFLGMLMLLLKIARLSSMRQGWLLECMRRERSRAGRGPFVWIACQIPYQIQYTLSEAF